MFTAFNRLLGQIFTLDREFAGGRYSRQPAHALRVAGDSYFLALIGRGYLERLSASKAEASSRLIGEAFVDRWDANDLLSRYQSLTTHDVRDRPDGRHDEILAELETKCLLMPCPSDHLLPVEDALIMHSELKNSILMPIESDLGHWAASQPPDSREYELMRAATLEFMSTL